MREWILAISGWTMSLHGWILGICGSVLLVSNASPLHGQERASEKKYTLQTDLVYHKPNDKELKLDIAVPATGKGPFPAVVCVHGGAWRMGNKKDLRVWLEHFAENGYVAVSVGYRLIPDNPWPAQIEDCKTAVRWLRANAEKYQVNKNKIGAMGYSAGGHLVCLLGTTTKKQGFEGKEYLNESSEVQAVCSYFGPTDLTVYGNDESAQNAVFKPMLGHKFKDNPTVYEKASPIQYVTKDAPPFLFFHGTADRLVPIEQSRSMHKKLKEVGVQTELIEVPNADHGWSGKESQRTTTATIQFFAGQLKK